MELTSSKKIDTNKYELVVTVGAEEFAPAVDRAYRKNVKKLSVPGFRKGKAPKAYVYKLYGEGVFYEDAVNELYPKAYREALDEAKIEPVTYPKIEVTSVDKEGFTFKAEVVSKPEVEVSEYRGIKAKKPVKTVEDGDIDAELDRMRHRGSRLIDITDRPAKDGDTVMIDFEGFVDGEAFEGGKAEGHSLRLGSGQFIPGFEEQVAGHGIGEEFEIQVTFPENYHEELRGKQATFKVLIHEIKEEELPELDDEFVKDVSEFDTMEELRADIREKLQQRFDEQADDAFENSLVEQLVGGMKAEVPAEMIDNKVAEMVRDYEYRLQAQGIPLEMFLEYSGQTPEAFRETFREPAEKQVRTRLVLEKVAQLEEIHPSDEEVDAEYQRLAERHKNEVEKLKEIIPAEDIRMDLAVRKAVDLIRESAVIVETSEEPKAEESVPEKAAKKPRRTKKAAEEPSEEK